MSSARDRRIPLPPTGKLAENLTPVDGLDGIDECGPGRLSRLVHKEGEPLRLSSLLVKPNRPFLDLAVGGEIGEETVRGHVSGDAAYVDPAEEDVLTGGAGFSEAGGGELGDGHPAVDLLRRFLQREEGPVDVLVDDESIALAPAGRPVMDHDGLLEVAEGGEDGAEPIGGRLPPEAANEKLPLGKVAVCDGADSVEDASIVAHGLGDDDPELVLGEGLEDLAGNLGGQPGLWRRLAGAVVVRLPLLGGGGIHGRRTERGNPYSPTSDHRTKFP